MGSMSKKSVQTGVSRRTIMAAGLAGACALAMPTILRAQDRSLKVGVYGFYFNDSSDAHILPAFNKAPGIARDFVAEQMRDAQTVSIETAALDGQAEGDVRRESGDG